MKTRVTEYRNNHHHSADFDFHLEGLELVEDPEGLRVGAHFHKPVPPRRGKPGLWARFVAWLKSPSRDELLDAEVFKGLENHKR